MDVDATSCLTDACTDFEQLHAQSFDLCRSQRRGQLQTKQVDHVVGETVEQQAEGIDYDSAVRTRAGSRREWPSLDRTASLADASVT